MRVRTCGRFRYRCVKRCASALRYYKSVTACALGNPLYEDFGLHYGRLFQMRDDLADGEAPAFAQELIEQETQEIDNLKYKLTI